MAQKVRREGLTLLKESSGDLVDFVFVHGLNGHPLDTWTKQAGRSDDKFCWLTHLPGTLHARVVTFGHMSDIAGGADNLMGLRQHAQTLLQTLKYKRPSGVRGRPIVFICHSLGGLIVKQALIMAAKKIEYEDIYSSTEAIFFFGTPHRGARLLDSKKRVAFVERLAKATGYQIPPNLRGALEMASNELFGVNDDFGDVKRDITIVNLYEAKKTASVSGLVVERESAVMDYPEAANIALMREHTELVRYDDEDDDTFLFIVEMLQDKLSLLLQLQSLNEDFQSKQILTGDSATKARSSVLAGHHEARILLTTMLGKELANFTEDCIRSLQFGDSSKRFEEVTLPHPKTFRWLWDEQAGIKAWFEGGSGLLWVAGKPGSGKSVFMKELYNQLREKCTDNEVIIPFFFSTQGSDLHKSVIGMLRVVVAGILRQASDLQVAILRAYSVHFSSPRISKSSWAEQELKKMLRDLLNPQQSRLNLILLVDALDECLDQSVMNIARYLRELTEQSNENTTIKICVSNRDMLNISKKFKSVSLQEWTQTDIEEYIEDKLADLVTDSERDTLDSLKRQIVDKANGVFLWVSLILDQLQTAVIDGTKAQDYEALLSKIPGQLTSLYEDMLNAIPTSYHKERDILLKAVRCAFKPLTVKELQVVLALSENQQTLPESSPYWQQDDTITIKMIKSRSGGLLETTSHHGQKIVQFIHQSVKDFLDGQSTAVMEAWNGFLLPDSHALMSKICLRYCALPSFETIRARLGELKSITKKSEEASWWEMFPLAEYAVQMWMRHCSEAEKLGFPQTAELEIFSSTSSDAFAIWSDLCSFVIPENFATTSGSLLPVATFYNLESLVRKLLDSHTDSTLHEGTKDYCLQLAAVGRYTVLCKLFVENGADVNVIGGHFFTPLIAAAYNGDEETVRFLLESGADANLQVARDKSPLSAAVCQGHNDIVGILLGHGDNDPEALQQALKTAASYGHVEVVKTLLEHGADAAAYDLYGLPVLFWGMVSSSSDLLEALVAGGADLSARAHGMTVLHWVSMYGQNHLVELLVQSGADIDCVDHVGATPLHFAALNWQPGALEVLLRSGADSSLPDHRGLTPLHLACAHSGRAQVESLIAAGADVKACDNSGMNLFHFAGLNRSADVLGGLLAARTDLEVDPTAADYHGRHPIHLAAEFGCPTSLKLLARLETELGQRDVDGREALHAAARRIDLKTLRYCLKAGANPLSVDDGGRTIFHHFYSTPTHLPQIDLNITLLDLLMEAGKAFRTQIQKKSKHAKKSRRKSQDRPGHSLQFKSQQSKEETTTSMIAKIDLLSENGLNLNKRDWNGDTVLHLACYNGDHPIIEYLLTRGADQTIENNDGIAPKLLLCSKESSV